MSYRLGVLQGRDQIVEGGLQEFERHFGMRPVIMLVVVEDPLIVEEIKDHRCSG